MNITNIGLINFNKGALPQNKAHKLNGLHQLTCDTVCFCANTKSDSDFEACKQRKDAFEDYFSLLGDKRERQSVVNFLRRTLQNSPYFSYEEGIVNNFPWEEFSDNMLPPPGETKNLASILKLYVPRENLAEYGGLKELFKTGVFSRNVLPEGVSNVLVARWNANANNFPFSEITNTEVFRQITKSGDNMTELLEKIKLHKPDDIKTLSLINFINNPNFKQNVCKLVNNSDLNEALNEIFDINSLTPRALAGLLTVNLDEKQAAKSIKQMAKSLKLALKTPNQYLSNIPSEYSEKIDGKYPALPPEILEQYQQKVTEFFKRNGYKILKALNYIDLDTFNQMMDRRFTLFQETLNEMDKLSDSNYKLLSRLIKCRDADGKKLTARQKIETARMIYASQSAGFDTSSFETAAENAKLDIPAIKNEIKLASLKKMGITQAQLDSVSAEKLNFNPEYDYLLSLCIDDKKSLYLKEIIESGLRGDFKSYITASNSPFGMANANTKDEFEKYGLNYEKWLNPDTKTSTVLNLKSGQLKLKMWNRNPLKDLFMGNDSNCCTALGSGKRGLSTLIYLANTAYNVVQLYDSSDNMVAISRIFMALKDNRPCLIMDNIEVNKSFAKNMPDDDLLEIRDSYFNYMNHYAQEITGSPDTRVYYRTAHIHSLPKDDLRRINANIDFIGDISSDRVYLNGVGEINPQELKNKPVGLYIVPDDISVNKHRV